MAQELTEFNEKTKDKDNLFTELKKLDEQKKPVENSEELEKRRQILKGVKQQIEKDEAANKFKGNSLNSKSLYNFLIKLSCVD